MTYCLLQREKLGSERLPSFILKRIVVTTVLSVQLIYMCNLEIKVHPDRENVID